MKKTKTFALATAVAPTPKPKPPAKATPPNQAAPITDATTLPTFLTVDDVAALLRRSRRSIYDLVERKLIPYFRPPGTRMIIFERDVILHWITSNHT